MTAQEQLKGRLVHKSNEGYIGECIQRRAQSFGWTGIRTSVDYSKLRYEYSTDQAEKYLNTLAPDGYQYGYDDKGHWGLWPR